MFARDVSRQAATSRLGSWSVAVIPLVFCTAAALAQTILTPQELAGFKRDCLAAEATAFESPPAAPLPVRYWGQAALAGGGNTPRGPADLYVGLQPAGNGFWTWGEFVYWALDDGKMSPSAVAVGGGRVTAYEFSFALHADFPDDTIQPLVIVSFYNAPLDPVAEATDPVVEPPSPVSSVAWLFDPITLPSAGEWAVRSGLIDLESWGVDFALDETYYVEVFPVEWEGDGWVYDPDVHATFTGPGTVTLGENQDHMWSDQWVRDEFGDLVFGDGDGFYDHPAEMDAGGDSPYLNQSGIILAGTECPGATLELGIGEPDDVCVQPGEPVTVTLSMSCIPGLVRGYQAFLEFDTAALIFGTGDYILPDPFGLPIIDPIVANGSEIDVAAGIDDSNGQQPTSTSAVLVTLNFIAAGTEGLTTVGFRSHSPPTRFSDEFGNEVVPTLLASPPIIVDGTPPLITCPADINVNADAGDCTASVNPGTATATDNLDPDPTIEYKRSDKPNWNEGLLDPYSQGSTTITWRATDCAGNFSECTQTVEVSGLNELIVDVELAGGVHSGPLTRCITFELWECPDDTGPKAIVEAAIAFTNGLASNVTVLVPCGNYNCITARDRLHTLRRTDVDDFGTTPIIGTQYVADFTDQSGSGGDDDSLIGGDLNDDGCVDILDFGIFTYQWNTGVGGDTDCDTPYPHADIDGDGIVGTSDFTFVQINFLECDEANCCGAPGPARGPRTRVSLEELEKLGMSELGVADLNNDGWLDEADMEAFLRGVRPKNPDRGPGGGLREVPPTSLRQRP